MERKFQIKISQHTPRWQIPEKLLPVVNLFIILCVRNCVCVLLYCVCATACVRVCVRVYAGCRVLIATPSWQGKWIAPAIDFWQTSPPTTILYLITNSLRRSNWSLSVWKKEIPHGIIDLYGPHLSLVIFFFPESVCACMCVCVFHASGNSRRHTNKPDGE